MRGALVLALAAAPAAAEEAIAVPSGQAVTLVDTLQDAAGPAGLTARFRFLAPAIAAGGGIGFDTAAADMQALCDGYALPRLAVTGPMPAQVVIVLMDRPVPFGEAAPEATQFFEAYRIEAGACVWEAF
jgi:hypothetical protein